MKLLTIKSAAAALVFSVGFIGIHVELIRTSGSGGEKRFVAGIATSTAQAQPARRSARRTSRRTARRTSARMNYYSSLPAGCVWRAPYHYCGGVYYRPVVQGGATVYAIVTP